MMHNMSCIEGQTKQPISQSELDFENEIRVTGGTSIMWIMHEHFTGDLQ